MKNENNRPLIDAKKYPLADLFLKLHPELSTDQALDYLNAQIQYLLQRITMEG